MGRNLRSRKLAAKACASKEDEINPVKTESKEEPLKKRFIPGQRGPLIFRIFIHVSIYMY